MNVIATIGRLTLRETQRRRILWVGLLMGLAFLTFFGLGFHFIYQDISASVPADEGEFEIIFNILTTAGLYATNFLVIMVAVLISVTAVSGEIESHTIDSLLTKPIGRWQLIAGKWLGFALIILLFVLLLPGGVLLIAYLRAGFSLNNVPAGLALIFLGGLVAMTLSLAGGTRLSTLANGALAFMMFGLAFVGGWVEQVGALLRNETAVNLGILAGLIMPSEVLWKKASLLFQPQPAGGLEFAGPFTVVSQPSDLMIVYAVVYMLALLGLGMSWFGRRDL
ncbi:MAG: ABC transporter permease [Candidatus Promineifilaceae bacterium]